MLCTLPWPNASEHRASDNAFVEPAPGPFRVKHSQCRFAANSLDRRQKNAVTPVGNEGQCGACWAFSSTDTIEGAHAIATGKLVAVSQQQLMDCSVAQGNQGCNGGLMDYAFTYVISNHGITTEADYPYTATGPNTCQTGKQAHHAVTISGFADVPKNQEAQLTAAVTRQPVSIAIDATQSSFQYYKSGVYMEPACGTQICHALTIVGYNTTASKEDYWIVKNMWGTSWGMDGYILMARHVGAAGLCGINMIPSYPIVNHTAAA